MVSTSPTKLKYSFGDSKTNRFPTVNPIRMKGHDRVGYDLPSTKSKRGAGFGIGERFVDMRIRKSKLPIKILIN